MKLLISHLVAHSYYKNILFNTLFDSFKDFEVVFLAETRNNWEGEVDYSYMEFPYSVLFKGSKKDVPLIKMCFRLLKTLKQKNPEIIYIGGYYGTANWIALIWAHLNKKKIIVEMDSNVFDKKRVGVKEFIKKIFIKRCDLGLTYGETSRQYLQKLGMPADNIIIKPNITDNDFWETKALEYKGKRTQIIDRYGFRGKNFIYVGRLSGEKNLFFLIDAFKKAKNQTPNREWGLILVGDGPQKEQLIDHVHVDNVKDVFFVGFKKRSELPGFYSAGDVLVLPSTREPWGVVINEAMASGLAVFASRQCGCAGSLVKEDRNGCQFSPYIKEELIDIFLKAMNNEMPLENMKGESQNIIRQFTPLAAARDIKEAINRLQ